eukprot:TRINITY_DN13802_c1_g2_i1.p1 TRINITY_DN13802_c1_g2~~TRINITY_DN13802_c1_g2_i1.p1  ORF type:complete len:128 (-),score=16.21 TRINITY_DN13802_c1_g2_i1:333-716(-)
MVSGRPVRSAARNRRYVQHSSDDEYAVETLMVARAGKGTQKKGFKIDLNKLSIASLQKYVKVFKLSTTPYHLTKEEMLLLVKQHFEEWEVDEMETIVEFVKAFKRRFYEQYGDRRGTSRYSTRSRPR